MLFIYIYELLEDGTSKIVKSTGYNSDFYPYDSYNMDMSFKIPENGIITMIFKSDSKHTVQIDFNTLSIVQGSSINKNCHYGISEKWYDNHRYFRHQYSSGNIANHVDIQIDEFKEYHPPLKIIMNEPLVKTSEQTMKIILDVELE